MLLEDILNISLFYRLITLFISLPALHQKFDLPAPFVLHTDCPHYWRYHLPGNHMTFMTCKIFSLIRCSSLMGILMPCTGEMEEEFSTRLANNLENLILKEGPETVIRLNNVSSGRSHKKL